MSKFSKLYNKLFDYSLQQGKHIKLKDMLNYRAHANVMIPYTTKYIYKEFPIRLAKRVLDLNNLPFGLAKTHSINIVRELYLNSFEELYNINEPKTHDDIIKFKNVIENIYNSHSTILSTMSMGLNDLHIAHKIDELEEPHMQIFLNNFHTNRCEMRLLLEQYISFFEKPRGDNFYGIINLETNIEEIINNSISDIQLLCDTHKLDLCLNDIIIVDNKGPGKITIPTIEHYLFYVFFEIIKNSIEAIKHKQNPYIEIMISEIDINWVLVKIYDNGIGINETDIERIWYYTFTTSPFKTEFLIPHTDFSIIAPLSGLGYGLPISDIYMNFLNSSKNNIKIYSGSNGTNVYIYLRRYLM